ncbi:MAG: response regulator, partial [Gammaproteobacteria bacterium]|nr:response regulator [Gammaproteobacteria bacterium]
HRGRAWLAGQKEAFQSAVNGASLDVSLGILIRTAIEQTEGDPRCAFYIADSRGQVLNHVTGMSDEFARCVANFRIGLDSIACGLAVASGQPVITADVVEDPLWKDWLWLARDHGYRACWSFPVETGTGKIVGSFAVYFPKPRQPTARDRELAAALTQSAAIIISRYQESEDLARARRALEANDRQKDEFLAMLAHELRNPLAAVSTAGELLSRTLHDNPRARVAIDVIRRQAGQLTRLVDDLLDIQRIAQGPITLQRRPIALSSIIEQAVETVEQQLVQKQQQLWVLDSEVPVYVYGDFARLMQCVVNVLTNAAKYTDAHGHIRIATRVADSSAVIEVSDTGVGIAAEVLPHVFDLFVQSHRTLDRAQGGLGIGLSVVRRLIEMHGGQVAARSPGLGLGSTFELRLPCIPPPLTSPSAEAFRAPPRRVLIVDDNADAANSLAMLLSQGNHEIEVAYSAQEALARIESFRPDVALLDIGLPEIDGYELARRLRTMPQLTGVRLVALTGYGQAADRQRTKAAGFHDHLVKPAELQALERALAGMVPAERRAHPRCSPVHSMPPG